MGAVAAQVLASQIEPRAAPCGPPPVVAEVAPGVPCPKAVGPYILGGNKGEILTPAEGYHEATCEYVDSREHTGDAKWARIRLRWRSKPTATGGYVGACGRLQDAAGTERRGQREGLSRGALVEGYVVEIGRILSPAREIAALYEGERPASAWRNAAAQLLVDTSSRAMRCPAPAQFVPPAPPRQRGELVGQIVGLEGDVVVTWPDGYRLQGTRWTTVGIGDVLRTGPTGRARILWHLRYPGREDVFISTFSANDEVDIRKFAADPRSAPRVVLDVLQGWIRTHKLAVLAGVGTLAGGVPAAVSAAGWGLPVLGFDTVGAAALGAELGVVAYVLGGDFIDDYRSDFAAGYDPRTNTATVLVREGSVSLRSRTGESRQLGTGQMITASRGRFSQPRPLDPGLWQRIVAATQVSPREAGTPGADPPTTRDRDALRRDDPVRGAIAPRRTATAIDITNQRLPIGPLAMGGGRQERVGRAQVVTSSSGYSTFDSIATQPARDYHASVGVRVERARGERAVAGLELKVGTTEDKVDGDVFFGKDDVQSLLLARWEDGGWVEIPRTPGATGVAAGRIDVFEVTKRSTRYEFRLNGQLIASWVSPTARAEWVFIWTGEGNRAEFHDWMVEKPE
jgi:hypothetical protein